MGDAKNEPSWEPMIFLPLIAPRALIV